MDNSKKLLFILFSGGDETIGQPRSVSMLLLRICSNYKLIRDMMLVQTIPF